MPEILETVRDHGIWTTLMCLKAGTKAKEFQRISLVVNVVLMIQLLAKGAHNSCDSLRTTSFVISSVHAVFAAYALLFLILTKKIFQMNDLFYDLSLIFNYDFCYLPMLLWIVIVTAAINACDSPFSPPNWDITFMLVYNTVSFVKLFIAFVAYLFRIPQANPVYNISVSKNDFRILSVYNSVMRRFLLKYVMCMCPYCWFCGSCDYIQAEQETLEEAEVRYKVDRSLENETFVELYEMELCKRITLSKTAAGGSNDPSESSAPTPDPSKPINNEMSSSSSVSVDQVELEKVV